MGSELTGGMDGGLWRAMDSELAGEVAGHELTGRTDGGSHWAVDSELAGEVTGRELTDRTDSGRWRRTASWWKRWRAVS